MTTVHSSAEEPQAGSHQRPGLRGPSLLPARRDPMLEALSGGGGLGRSFTSRGPRAGGRVQERQGTRRLLLLGALAWDLGPLLQRLPLTAFFNVLSFLCRIKRGGGILGPRGPGLSGPGFFHRHGAYVAALGEALRGEYAEIARHGLLLQAWLCPSEAKVGGASTFSRGRWIVLIWRWVATPGASHFGVFPEAFGLPLLLKRSLPEVVPADGRGVPGARQKQRGGPEPGLGGLAKGTAPPSLSDTCLCLCLCLCVGLLGVSLVIQSCFSIHAARSPVMLSILACAQYALLMNPLVNSNDSA